MIKLDNILSKYQKYFLDSLDLNDAEIIPFIPEILKDLWELGSMPDYIIDLVEKHISPDKATKHPHPYFGKLTPQEWAVLKWKHYDHHLRQFGA